MRLIPLKRLKEQKGIEHHVQSIRRLVRDGLFPRPIKVGNRSAFVEEEIDNWIKAQISKRDAKEATYDEAA